MIGTVMNGLRGREQFCVSTLRQSRVGISIEPREIAAGDLHTDVGVLARNRLLVTHMIDFEPIDLPWLKRLRFEAGITPTGSNDAVAKVVSFSIWMYVDQFRREISVLCGRRGEQDHLHRAGDLERLFRVVRRCKPVHRLAVRSWSDRMAPLVLRPGCCPHRSASDFPDRM